MSKILGLAIVLIGLAVAILPQHYTCGSAGLQLTLVDGRQVPMKCTWTGRAEIAVGVPLAVVGAAMAVSRRRETKGALGVVAVALGALAIAVPTKLIGVCSMPTHTCVTVLKPAMIALGTASIVGGATMIMVSLAQKKKAIA